ncbi:hypothetical protein B0H17DRAFT_922839 [Mycena rosella]|uniref:Uncharacterized protein n=1 Tax=Mycena rosella TaxID=1033263 RepID=A0AAD7E1V1_MYCRO|nr:hypothetical protein B0H17DRAFT_922839 [Mycena rosella]
MAPIVPLATPVSTLVECPAKAPAWFSEARAQITRRDLGCHFHAVVAAWTRVEEASRFQQGPTNLPAKGRPQVVGTWIANRRGKRGEPVVEDIAGYAEQWQKWWDSLQLRWRERGEEGEWKVEGGYGEEGKEWGPLYQWGVNGMLSIVASLYFWGCALNEDSEAQAKWEAAVRDVAWMLEGMAVSYGMFKGRW